ncbi:hypothetical protein HY992_04225 [Candidatus Micrarchaeota archaeon]|nr:hypothetical protein [Candidatus Micrarchaeota archaeon]
MKMKYVLAAFAFLASLALAQATSFTNSTAIGAQMSDWVCWGFNSLVLIAALATVGIGVWGGVEKSQAGSDPLKDEKANNKIKGAILGIIAILIIFGLGTTVLNLNKACLIDVVCSLKGPGACNVP